MKATYAKIARYLPDRWRTSLEASFFNPAQLVERLQIRRAIHSGPPYRPSHKKIIIDITASCDLGCMDCNRSCSANQAPSHDHMSVEQIEGFLRESVEQGRRWEEIAIEGGEPTLHPQLRDIVKLLLHYRESFSPRTHIQLLTNGYGPQSAIVRDYLRTHCILVIDTRKANRFQPHHCAFNIAPGDLAEMSGMDFSQGCYLPACYGLGLTRYGYYPHPICGGIDRVFGFDIGRKRLPAASDSMQEQLSRLCTLCGFFRHSLLSRDGPARGALPSGMSISWKAAYERYWAEKPILEPYRK